MGTILNAGENGAPRAGNGRPLRVLIADTQPILRAGLKQLLERHGLEVVAEACSGAEAVEVATSALPDLAILNIMMPELDGLATGRRIRAISPNTRMLLLCNEDDLPEASEALSSGISGYVQTRQDPQTLIQAVLRVASGGLQWDSRGAAPNGSRRRTHLSPRESEVLRLVAEGRSTKEIASGLGLSAKTIEAHRARLMGKLGIHDVATLVRYAIQLKVVEP